ncbi:hypothetical protein SAMN05443428_1383 [Caloramator quimbayensis]|uniref:Uncharacterized protein n=1 Tax=Caloramator quimbayensis TaxID=1147123 RepID=A0A1T4YDX8_9CLOT|nr:hypothetical protein [Caloramator quimbayensis]SKA99748.1 hypothetical protein SAMN05443428_1383 [Caloramator quimbayensis]
MREVVSYNKDFLSNTVFIETKLKDERGIKGKVLVELFDSKTNKKVKEAYTENIIPDLFFKDMFIRHFAGGIMGIGPRESDYYNNNFECIYLTDSTKPESANTERISGNITGYAYRNTEYSGTDPLRGTINKAESKMELANGKIRVTFVFDFPTHAANGKFESIYWGCDMQYKDYHYIGPYIWGRNNYGDGYENINCNLNPNRFWALTYGLLGNGFYTRGFNFTDYYKGYTIVDGSDSSIYRSSYISFPQELIGHLFYIPFDFNRNEFVDFSKAVKLLNSSGGAFGASNITEVMPIYDANGDIDYFIGIFIRYSSPNYYMRIYKWSKVGVLIHDSGEMNITTKYKDEYNTNFNYQNYSLNPLYWGDGYIEIYGFNSRTDTQYNETVYTNRLLRVDLNGNIISELNLKPKIGSSTWFASKRMNSGNIERRCYLKNLTWRTRNRIYLYYNGIQGGSSFYQAITPDGNILEPVRNNFGIYENYFNRYNILGTDKNIAFYSYYSSPSYNIALNHLALNGPCGAHTKLAQPVEKTDANTMKIQYTFEIDLIDYAFDYY